MTHAHTTATVVHDGGVAASPRYTARIERRNAFGTLSRAYGQGDTADEAIQHAQVALEGQTAPSLDDRPEGSPQLEPAPRNEQGRVQRTVITSRGSFTEAEWASRARRDSIYDGEKMTDIVPSQAVQDAAAANEAQARESEEG